jgi:uroporphyrinogen decarboxylase
MATDTMTSRERVNMAMAHREPDRVPLDFLAVPEIFDALAERLRPDPAPFADLDRWMQPEREALLAAVGADCRLLSYDMFVKYPASLLRPGAREDWWSSANRSTPNRMWRQMGPDGLILDVFGIGARRSRDDFGVRENYADHPLAEVRTVDDLSRFTWPEPDWWDFSEVPEALDKLTASAGDVHVRYRVGSVFEIAWQLRGLEAFLMDLLAEPDLAEGIMDRLADLHVENTRRFLQKAAGRVDMIYVYDDVATSQSLLMSLDNWRTLIRPRHERIVAVAREFGVKFMYHTDGAVWPLIPDLIEMGVDLLNPIQTDLPEMDAARLKRAFGDRLSFHGGVSIVDVLPKGAPAAVSNEVRRLVNILGADGGYILSSSHHIQADTPAANVLAMTDPALRARAG